MISNGFIINPDSRLLPVYRISPFDNNDIFINRKLEDSFDFESYFSRRFENYNWCYTLTGRDAIKLALQDCQLHHDDVVTILTTTGNFYISGCVTGQIEKICRWNREITGKTKVILVNHEFGFPYEDLRELKKFGLPIIEDCAHSFCSQNEENSVGTVGDYLVFSLPKYFPIQIGGIFGSCKRIADESMELFPQDFRYIRKVLGKHTPSIKQFAAQRVQNYNYFKELFSRGNYLPRFDIRSHHVPGVFMFNLHSSQNGQGLKDHLWKNGIESSAFYKENAIYIPVHHKLRHEDMDFIYEITLNYLES